MMMEIYKSRMYDVGNEKKMVLEKYNYILQVALV
jgi:hypothetical protein